MNQAFNRLAAWLAAGVAGVALTGCVVAPVDGGYYDNGSGYYDSGYDTYYDSGAYYPGGGNGYYNGTYYPAIPREVVPVAPFVGALWIGGHWDNSRGNRRWVPGRYDRPGHGHGHNRPGWDRPNDNRPGWNRPDNNRPGWNQPGNNRPGWNQPNRPTDSRPSWNQPNRPVRPSNPNENQPDSYWPSRSGGQGNVQPRPGFINAEQNRPGNRPQVTRPAQQNPAVNGAPRQQGGGWTQQPSNSRPSAPVQRDNSRDFRNPGA